MRKLQQRLRPFQPRLPRLVHASPALTRCLPARAPLQDKKRAEEERAKELADLFAMTIKQPKVPAGERWFESHAADACAWQGTKVAAGASDKQPKQPSLQLHAMSSAAALPPVLIRPPVRPGCCCGA